MSRKTIAGFTAYEANGGGVGVPLIARGASGDVFLANPDGTISGTEVTCYRKETGADFTPFSNIHGYVETFWVDVPDLSTAAGVYFVSGNVRTFQPFMEGQRGAPGLPGTNGVATDEAVATNILTSGTSTRSAAFGLVDDVVSPIWDERTREVIANTGSNTRSLLNALYGGGGSAGVGAGFVSVMDYSAKGDGTTDDAPAIQAALDDKAGTIVFPPGYTFLLKERIRISADTHIMAYGSTILRDTAATHMVRNYREAAFDGVNDEFPGYTGHGNITVQGGTWDNNSRLGSSGNTFTFAHCANLTFRDMTCIRNRDHVFDLPGCDGVLIENLWMLGFEVTASHKEAIQVDSCISGAASMRPLDGTTTKNLVVRGCRVGPYTDPITQESWPSCGRFVGSHSVSTLGVPFENIQVLDNTVDGAQSRGIAAYGWDGFRIAGNTISGTVAAGITVETAAGIQVTSGDVDRNEVIDNKSDNAYRVDSGTTAAEMKNISLTGNHSRGSSNTAYRIGKSTGTFISGNKATGSSTGNASRAAYTVVGAVDPFIAINQAAKSGAPIEAEAALRITADCVRPRYVLNNFLDGLTVVDDNSGSITT